MVANEMVNVKLLPQVHKIYFILLVFKFGFDIFLHFDYPYFGLKNVVSKFNKMLNCIIVNFHFPNPTMKQQYCKCVQK